MGLSQFSSEFYITTASIRSLGQGNIFRSVCQEFCPQGGWYPSMHCRWYLSMPCMSPGPHPRGKLRGLAWGVSRPTPRGEVEVSSLGGVSKPTPGGVSRPTPGGGSPGPHLGGSPGPHLGGGVGIPACTEADPPLATDSYCCRQYASYWNAFLLPNNFSVDIGLNFVMCEQGFTIHLLNLKYKYCGSFYRNTNVSFYLKINELRLDYPDTF